ncbi:hypothetical protein [Pelosinus sp. sgz500959]|uniref:hypothetical protein n=1 Tax=Pelosinus sp. sgz500959 TaxID=3242472 RepID=UPI00366D19C6
MIQVKILGTLGSKYNTSDGIKTPVGNAQHRIGSVAWCDGDYLLGGQQFSSRIPYIPWSGDVYIEACTDGFKLSSIDDTGFVIRGKKDIQWSIYTKFIYNDKHWAVFSATTSGLNIITSDTDESKTILFPDGANLFSFDTFTAEYIGDDFYFQYAVENKDGYISKFIMIYYKNFGEIDRVDFTSFISNFESSYLNAIDTHIQNFISEIMNIDYVISNMTNKQESEEWETSFDILEGYDLTITDTFTYNKESPASFTYDISSFNINHVRIGTNLVSFDIRNKKIKLTADISFNYNGKDTLPTATVECANGETHIGTICNQKKLIYDVNGSYYDDRDQVRSINTITNRKITSLSTNVSVSTFSASSDTGINTNDIYVALNLSSDISFTPLSPYEIIEPRYINNTDNGSRYYKTGMLYGSCPAPSREYGTAQEQESIRTKVEVINKQYSVSTQVDDIEWWRVIHITLIDIINNINYDLTPMLAMIIANNEYHDHITSAENMLVSDIDEKRILFYITFSGVKSFYFIISKDTHDIKYVGQHDNVIQNKQLFKIPIATARKFINQMQEKL